MSVVCYVTLFICHARPVQVRLFPVPCFPFARGLAVAVAHRASACSRYGGFRRGLRVLAQGKAGSRRRVGSSQFQWNLQGDTIHAAQSHGQLFERWVVGLLGARPSATLARFLLSSRPGRQHDQRRKVEAEAEAHNLPVDSTVATYISLPEDTPAMSFIEARLDGAAGRWKVKG